MQPWHTISGDTALEKLETSSNGLPSLEAKKRLEYHGHNQLPEVSTIHPVRIFLNQFMNPLVIILLFAVGLAFVLHELIDAVVILLIVTVNSLLGFWQELKAERTIEALRHITAQQATTVRDGKQQRIDTKYLVPGDIVILTSGDKVAADMIILNSHQLSVNESLLTGESNSVKKSVGVKSIDTPLAERNNMVFSGTIIENGRAVGLVVNTGSKTELGKIATLVHQEKKSQTPLQKRLAHLAHLLGKVCLLLIIPIIIFSIIRGDDWYYIFELSVSLAVSMVPEGLAVVVTIALAVGIKRMFFDHALIRRLPVVEVLGNTDVICTDKTGTLTTNEMTMTAIFTRKEVFSFIDENKLSMQTIAAWQLPATTTPSSSVNPHTTIALTNIIQKLVLCSDATAETGDPTEIALVKQSARYGFNINSIRDNNPRLDEIPFSSEYKYMATLHDEEELIVKGSLEAVLQMCDKVVSEHDQLLPLTSEERRSITTLNEQLAQKGKRILAIAYKHTKDTSVDKSNLTGLSFLGLVTLEDPPRTEVRGAIEECYRAGIRVIMITGDHSLTAQAVAETVGIETTSVTTGCQIDNLTDEELRSKVEDSNIFARVTSEHKLRILKALQANGHITAMGGDGVNDAPALKKADIGFSVGNGTDLAKEVADMILLDNNFATIPKAVKQGRVIFQNIRNFLKLMLATNFNEVVIVTASILLNIPVIYIPIHILWINLLSDGLPASALAFDDANASCDVMSNKPNTSEQGLFTGIWPFIIVGALLSIISDAIVFSSFYPWWSDATSSTALDTARTAILTSAVVSELLVVFICRTKNFAFAWKRINNSFLVFASLLSFALLLITVYSPFLNHWFQTVPLTKNDWVILLIPTLITTALLEMFKLHYYRNKQF